MSKFNFDERNNADYLDMTARIHSALEEIERNAALPATEVYLSKIAGCSRGTLRNRIKPLVRLKLIKESRKIKRKKKVFSAEPEELGWQELKDSLLSQTYNNRCELSIWYNKCGEMESELRRFRRNIVLLEKKVETLLKKNKELNLKLSELGSEDCHVDKSNVISISNNQL